MSRNAICFIGGGNMATSLIGGLVADGRAPDSIWVSDVDEDRLGELGTRFGVHTTSANRHAVSRADTVVLAVKPQTMTPVLAEIADAIREVAPLVVSIAAGVREPDIRRRLGHDASIVRTMPNTPALLRAGATALYANPFVTAEQRARAEGVMRAAGLTVWVEDESLLDAVTAVSGSGPAYFFRLMELMEETGASLGLPRETARQLVLQTALGAARMALEGEDAPGTLRERVTSPGGTTQAALEAFGEGGLAELVERALRAARDRAVALGDDLGHD